MQVEFYRKVFGYRVGQVAEIDEKKERRLKVWLAAGICGKPGEKPPAVRKGGKAKKPTEKPTDKK